MKTNLKTPASGALKMCAKAGAAALLLLGSVGMLQAQPSPVGTWDCTISGRDQSGLAFISFDVSNTFSMFRLLSSSHPSNPGTAGSTAIGRDGADIGRNSDSGAGGTSSEIPHFLIGADTLTNGTWTFDERGRIVGRLIEVVDAGRQTCTTNPNIARIDGVTTIAVTNNPGQTNEFVSFFTTNVVIFVTNGVTVTCSTNSGTTNGISFIGRAVPGRRLSLVASTPNGKITYRGTPFKTNLTDLSGDWLATRLVNKRSFLETFTLTPWDFPNIFVSTVGSGPDYPLTAVAFLSSHKKIGLSLTQGDTNGASGSFVGTLRTSKTGVLSTSGRGLQLDTTPVGTLFQYHAARQVAPVAP